MIKAGIIGGGGYTAGELIRILYLHPEAELRFVYSESQSGKKISAVHEDLAFLGDFEFSDHIQEADVLFLCQGHGRAIEFFENYNIDPKTLVIDLGNDYRLHDPPDSPWVYGLPELHRNRIAQSKRIANCGCFATAIQLALLPLAYHNLITDDIHISAITGSTGAGQRLQPTTHFTWRSENISVYKAFTHQHEDEILQSLRLLQPSHDHTLRFVPFRGNFTRGIFASIYTKMNIAGKEAIRLYQDYYKTHPFVFLSDRSVTLKQVVNTNYCYLHLSAHNDILHIESVIDNLLKGASGQAVQNMNIAFGLKEESGLFFKPSAY